MEDASNPGTTTTDHASAPTAAPIHPRPARSARSGSGRGRQRHERLTFDAPRSPETTGAWLHVISGPSSPVVARGALELAARFLACGHRVLIVDGSPRLQLHDRFDREMRWGVVECLTGEMPVLGLVQDVGRLGLYLLAHGMPAKRTHWPQLGRVLDEARPHFGRLVLALDADAPAAIGEALAGWHLEGWWSERGRRKRPATAFSDRLGIHLAELDLEELREPRLELLDARLWALTTQRVEAAAHSAPAPTPNAAPTAPAMTSAPAVSSAPVAVSPRPALASTPVVPTAHAGAPTTLDSDVRVRERLRFLLWMRRIQSEGRRPDRATEPSDAAARSR
jgi:hypothetical protein